MPEISTVSSAIKNIITRKGDTLSPVTLKFYTQVGLVKTPINIMADSFSMNVTRPTNGAVVLSFTNGNGFTLQNTNELVMSKTAAQMNIQSDTYTYQLKRTLADTTVKTVLLGEFVVL